MRTAGEGYEFHCQGGRNTLILILGACDRETRWTWPSYTRLPGPFPVRPGQPAICFLTETHQWTELRKNPHQNKTSKARKWGNKQQSHGTYRVKCCELSWKASPLQELQSGCVVRGGQVKWGQGNFYVLLCGFWKAQSGMFAEGYPFGTTPATCESLLSGFQSDACLNPRQGEGQELK